MARRKSKIPFYLMALGAVFGLAVLVFVAIRGMATGKSMSIGFGRGFVAELKSLFASK